MRRSPLASAESRSSRRPFPRRCFVGKLFLMRRRSLLGKCFSNIDAAAECVPRRCRISISGRTPRSPVFGSSREIPPATERTFLRSSSSPLPSVRKADIVRAGLKQAAVQIDRKQRAHDSGAHVGRAEGGRGGAVFGVLGVPGRFVCGGVGRERVALRVLVALLVENAVEVGLEGRDLIEI